MNSETMASNAPFNEADDVYNILYGILNCTPDNNASQITTEYKRLALRYHPDKLSHTQPPSETDDGVDGEIIFKRIQLAYSILGNIQSRQEYDTWLHSGLKVPFLKWKMLGSQSTHWSNRPQQKALAHQPPTGNIDSKILAQQDERITEALYARFRTYDI